MCYLHIFRIIYFIFDTNLITSNYLLYSCKYDKIFAPAGDIKVPMTNVRASAVVAELTRHLKRQITILIVLLEAH